MKGMHEPRRGVTPLETRGGDEHREVRSASADAAPPGCGQPLFAAQDFSPRQRSTPSSARKEGHA
jgi:hypothetical protein